MNKIVKTVLTVLIVLVVIFLIALPKLSFWDEDNKAAVPENPAVDKSGLPVEVVIVEPRSLDNSINITGEIRPNEAVALTSELAGKISNIYFKEGDNVRKGELLVKINDDELRAQLERLKHTRQLYEDTEKRMSQLLERDAISQEEYDISLTELKTSTADIKALEVQINRAHIKAPFAGVIGLRSVSEGSYITPSEIIANLYSVDPAKVEFSIPGRYGNIVNTGDKISFTIEGSDEVFAGEVYATEPRIDPETRTLFVRALSPNKDRKLIPGQYVRIALSLESKEDVILVPTMAVIPEANGHLVFKMKDGKADSVKVTIGNRGAQEVEILAGLQQGDTVVVSGIQQIKDGADLLVQSVRQL